MRRLTLAVVLACALCGIARAGEVPTTGVIAPPPPPNPVITSGEVPLTGATTLEPATDVLAIVLTIISSVY
jgi:hypothetical protein